MGNLLLVGLFSLNDVALLLILNQLILDQFEIVQLALQLVDFLQVEIFLVQMTALNVVGWRLLVRAVLVCQSVYCCSAMIWRGTIL